MEEKKAVKNFLIILAVVLVCGIAVYFLTRAFVSKDLFTKKDDDKDKIVEVTTSYDTAIVGTMLNRPVKEYYVLVYDQKEDNGYNNIGISYTSDHSDGLPLYYVDLANPLNKEHVGDKTDVSGSVKDMVFGELTLLRVKDGKITKTITDYDKVIKELDVELTSY